MLDLPVCAWVGDHGPVHPDIIIIIEIQEIFPDELGAIVDDDVVRDPKIKNDVLDEIYCLLGANVCLALGELPLELQSMLGSSLARSKSERRLMPCASELA
jgi:hypothetical protein